MSKLQTPFQGATRMLGGHQPLELFEIFDPKPAPLD